MEDRRRRDSSSPPVIEDLAVTQGCEYSKIRFHPIENSEKTTWTDEKHNMYLDHLESSFVKQLHRSVLKNHSRCAGIVKTTKMPGSSNAMNFSKEQIFERHGKSLDYFEGYLLVSEINVVF